MRELGLAFALLLPFAVLGMNCHLRGQGLPRHLLAAILAADLIVVAAYALRPRIRNQILLLLYSILITYLGIETVYTSYASTIRARYYAVFDEPPNSEYDPIRGYKYAPRPARWSLIESDQVQFSTSFKGNNYGFAVKSDYSPHREAGERRVVVLGDSYTGMPIGDELWPDYVERRAAGEGKGLRLLTLALGGIGVPNWTSMLEGLVIKEGWDVDEIVFAVFEGDDLRRTFLVAGQSAGRPFMYKLDRWMIPSPTDPEPPPRPIRPGSPMGGSLVLTKAEYDRFLRERRPDRYPPSVLTPRLDRLYVFDSLQRFTEGISSAIKARLRGDREALQEGGPGLKLTDEMRPIFERLRAAVRRIGKPVKVIYIPSKPEILADRGYRGYNEVKDFAEFLGARLYDGREAFRSMPARERMECFFPVDEHWTDAGIRQFGEYVYRRVLLPDLEDRRAAGPRSPRSGASRPSRDVATSPRSGAARSRLRQPDGPGPRHEGPRPPAGLARDALSMGP